MGFVSEDGTVTGSVDVSQLDEIDPKTDEAKAQIDALKAQRDAGQEQVAADEQRLAEGDKAPGSEPVEAERDEQGVPASSEEKSEEAQPAAEEAKPAEQSAEQKSGRRQAPGASGKVS